MNRLRARSTIVVSLIALLAVVVARYRATAPGYTNFAEVDMPLDLWIYLRGGERVQAGADLYAAPIYEDLPFTYPPFAGWLFSLASTLDDATVAPLTLLLSTMCTAFVVFASFASVRGMRFGRWWSSISVACLVTLLLLIGTEPPHATLFWGQVNLMLMALVCADFLLGKRSLPGIGVGLAAGIKLTPAFFVLLFLVQRRWWAAFGSGVTFLVTVVIGWIAVPDAKVFWTDAMFSSERVGVHDNPGAQSLRSVLARTEMFDSTAVWGAAVLVVTGLVAWAAWLAVRRGTMPAAVGLVGIGACLVSPFSWYHHWVWIVPFAVAVFLAANAAAGSLFNDHPITGLLSTGALLAVAAPFTAANVSRDWLVQAWSAVSGPYVWAGLIFLLGYIAYALAEPLRRHRRRAPQG